MDAVTFTAPERGEWISLRDHFPRALTPEYGQLLTHGMEVGEAKAMEAYGLPIRGLGVRLVHGHVYIAPIPLVGGYTDRVPPRALLWVAARLVPAFRARNRAARAALQERPWLDQAERWFSTERDQWAAASAALQAEPVEAMDPPALVDHLERALAHARAGYERHFALHGPDLIPTGLLLARCREWGLPADAVLPVLAGASPASTGESASRRALQEAVASSGRAVRTFDELTEVAGPALTAFLDEQGWRLVTGYDLDDRALVELPELVVAIATGVAADDAALDAALALDALLAAAPLAHEAELRQLVEDARATFGVRDDNGALTAAWPVGLLRRAVLAAGAALAPRGALAEPAHAVEASIAELTGLLQGGDAPTAEEVAERASDRARRSRLEPPPTLGPPTDLPLDLLPEPMRLVTQAQLVLRDSFTTSPGARASLSGEGIGDATHRGRAVVATDPADALARLEPGDVLVALGTTPAYNVVLSLVGAVVVEEGGLLAHAAVIARELGLPAVIGVAGAMAAIPDGAQVEVDPRRGRVQVLDVPSLSPGPESRSTAGAQPAS
ncbi:MAG: PEP-utilizing enzyme [Acidimicrobiales bacterium]